MRMQRFAEGKQTIYVTFSNKLPYIRDNGATEIVDIKPTVVPVEVEVDWTDPDLVHSETTISPIQRDKTM